MSNMAKLEVKNLTISFRTNNGAVRAVRDISFNLNEGETLAIAGESGSGKSVTTRAVIGILAANAMVDNGEIIYDGKDLLKISEDDFHTLRGHKLSMVFQDPLSALNPIMRIGKQLTEAMILNNKERRQDGRTQFNRMLGLLEKAMAEQQGNSADVKAKVSARVKEFDGFVLNGIKMQESYENALEASVEAGDYIEQIENALYKKDEKNVRDLAGLFVHACKSAMDTFFIPKDDSAYMGLVDKVEAMGKKFTMAQADELRGLMKQIGEKIKAATEKETPDFFSIGYYGLHGGDTNPKNNSVASINAAAKKALDEGFLNSFKQEVAAAIADSEKKNRVEQKKAIEVLKAELPTFKAEKLDERACRASADRASAAVEKAIDPLAIEKDSRSYVFKSSMKANIDRYFKSLTHNPKEEKRFARDTVKHEKLVKKNKIAGSVVPMNLIDTEKAHANLVAAVEQLISSYETVLSVQEKDDTAQRAQAMIDYLKARAGEAAYNLTMGMAKHRAIELMKEVGIPEPHKRYNQYPFELSGGMRQRIVIAIALSANPDILICDEPTTALDVTIQAQILELINRLKRERKLSVIFITHDLGVVANMADRIAIMYAGKIVEYGTADDVFYDPRHPYTWALLSSMPDLETKTKLEAIPGTPPNMIVPPKGDAFAERNHYAMQIDFEEQPPMFNVSETHQAATWLLHPDAPKVQPPAIVLERIERMKRRQAATVEGGAVK